MVHTYTTENTIHQFDIGYMVNPALHINREFREKGQKYFGCSFSTKTLKTIRDFHLEKTKSGMALMVIYIIVEKT